MVELHLVVFGIVLGARRVCLLHTAQFDASRREEKNAEFFSR